MTIDNFETFKSRLDFRDKTDRYIVHVLRRPKDCEGLKNALGSNECQRLIRTYYVDSIDYFEKKIPAIKELCESNRARAYILPQVRNNYECLLNLGEKVLETIRLGNYSAKPEHLLRSAYCEYHKSRNKVWILDLDADCMTEYRDEATFGGHAMSSKTWTPAEAFDLVKRHLVAVGKSEDDCYMVPTKSGFHIITSPFNLQAAYKECGLLYEGVKKAKTKMAVRYLKPGDRGYTGSPGLDRRFEFDEKDVVGWLHKDGMSLLYYTDGKTDGEKA